MPVTPQAIQELLERLEASRQSRLRAWECLQRLRVALTQHGRMEIPVAAPRTFDVEGQILESNLTAALRDRNRALGDLYRTARRFQAMIPREDDSDERATARAAMLAALDRAGNLLR